MKYRYLVLAGAIAQAGIANGMGLGNLNLQSYLGSPLQANISLVAPRDVDQSQIRVRIARLDVYDRMGAHFEAFHNAIEFNVEQQPGGQLIIHAYSNKRVTEPYLDLVVELSWPEGTSYRRYSVLLDPPGYAARWQQHLNQQVAAVEPAVVNLARKTPKPVTHSQQLPPLSGNSYRVRHGDSLWKIARRLRGNSDASLHAIMAQLFAANPDAFIQGDRNRLKLGATLQLPALESNDTRQIAQHRAPSMPAPETAAVTAPPPVARENPTPSTSEQRTETGKTLDIREQLAQAQLATQQAEPETPADILAAIAQLQQEKMQLKQFQLQVKTEMVQLQQQRLDVLKALNATVDTQAETAGGAAAQPVPQPVDQMPAVETPAVETPVAASTAAEIPAAEAPVAEPVVSATPAVTARDAGQPAQPKMRAEPRDPTQTTLKELLTPSSRQAPPRDVAADMAMQDLIKPTPELSNTQISNSGPSLWYLLGMIPLGLLVVLLGMRSQRVQRIRETEQVKDEDLHELVFGTRRDRSRAENPEQLQQALNQIREKAGSFEKGRDHHGHGMDGAEGRDDLKQMIELYLLYSQYQKALNVILTEISKRPARPDLRLYLMQVYASMGDWKSFDEQLAILRSMGNPGLLEEATKMRETMRH